MRNIPLMTPTITEEDIEHVSRVLRSGMLVQGKEVETLENRIADYTGTKYAVCVSNGTASLHLSLIALGVGVGDEVILPAFSYIATANVIELVGATPIFIDISLETFNIDETLIESCITPRTKAIIPVHEFGLLSNMELIMKIAQKHKLFVIEDSACALGATQHLKHAGSFGHLGSFSFHPRKAITSGEGGVITTNDPKLAQCLRKLRNHGIDMTSGKMDFVDVGYNYRLTDFQAAMINSQFNRFETILNRKRQIAQEYQQKISNKNIVCPKSSSGSNHTWQTFHILWKGQMSRDNVIIQLKEKGIGSNYGAQCIPAQTYFYNKYQLDSERLFPNSFNAFTNGIALPIYDKIQQEDVQYISDILNTIQ